MKKFILTFIFCGSLLLPVADLYAHGDPGTVLFALGLRKALETFAKKFELATAAGKTLTVYYQNGVDSETDILYIEQNGKYSAVEIPHLPVGMNIDTSGREFLLFNLLLTNSEVKTAAIFTGKNWYKMELIDFPRDMVTLNLYDGEEKSVPFEHFFNAPFHAEERADWLKKWNRRYQIKTPNFPLKSEVGNLEHGMDVKSAKDIMPVLRNSAKIAKGFAGELKKFRKLRRLWKKFRRQRLKIGRIQQELWKQNSINLPRLLMSHKQKNCCSNAPMSMPHLQAAGRS